MGQVFCTFCTNGGSIGERIAIPLRSMQQLYDHSDAFNRSTQNCCLFIKWFKLTYFTKPTSHVKSVFEISLSDLTSCNNKLDSLINCYFRISFIISEFDKVHWEKGFDWMKKNNLFERLFLIQTKYLFELNNICFITKKKNIFAPNKYLFKSNECFFKTKELLHWYRVKDIICLI